jgi:hypothetical protein
LADYGVAVGVDGNAELRGGARDAVDLGVGIDVLPIAVFSSDLITEIPHPG